MFLPHVENSGASGSFSEGCRCSSRGVSASGDGGGCAGMSEPTAAVGLGLVAVEGCWKRSCEGPMDALGAVVVLGLEGAIAAGRAMP